MEKNITFSPDKNTFFDFFYKRLDSVNISKKTLESILEKDCNLLFNRIYKRFKLVKSDYFIKNNKEIEDFYNKINKDYEICLSGSGSAMFIKYNNAQEKEKILKIT